MEAHSGLRRFRAGDRQRRLPSQDDRLRRERFVASSTQDTLDRVTHLAGEVLGVSAVCVSVVDPQWRLLMSSYGVSMSTALLLSHAFRKQVVASRSPLVITDGRRDPLVARNPAVRDGTVRACVGMPLGTADGRPVGTLLAMDRKPRQWTASQLDFLGRLSALVLSEIEVEAAVRRASQGDVAR